VGAQQPGRVGAQRPGGLVAAAAAAPDGDRRGHAADPGLDQRGLRRRGPVGPLPELGPVPGGVVRVGARPGRRAGGGGAHGRHADRQDSGVGADRPARRPPPAGRGRGHRACRGGLQDRPPPAVGRRRAQLAGAGGLRAGRLAGAAARLPAGGAAPPAVRAGSRLGAHPGHSAAAPAPGRGRGRGVRRGRRADAGRAFRRGQGPGVPAQDRTGLRLVRPPAQLPRGPRRGRPPSSLGRPRRVVSPPPRLRRSSRSG
jgi:hypothetical protein